MAKHKHQEEHEEGEAWLMSYADLVTLLLAIFVLLFSMASLDNERVSQVTKAISTYMTTRTVDTGVSVGDVSLEERQLLAYRRLANFLDLGHPDEVLARLDKIQESPEEVRKLLALAERMGLYGNAKMNQESLRYEVVIPMAMAFEDDGPYLLPKGLELLKALAPRLRESLRDPRRSLEIAGHTDSNPLPDGSEFSSLHILSAARAEAASLTLQELGVDGRRVSIVGKGPTEPVAPERNARGQDIPGAAAKNRRLVISILTEPALVARPAQPRDPKRAAKSGDAEQKTKAKATETDTAETPKPDASEPAAAPDAPPSDRAAP
jgi:chemotaxis protein MotB